MFILDTIRQSAKPFQIALGASQTLPTNLLPVALTPPPGIVAEGPNDQ